MLIDVGGYTVVRDQLSGYTCTCKSLYQASYLIHCRPTCNVKWNQPVCIIPHFSFVTLYPYPILTKLRSSQNVISLLVYKSCHKHIIYVILHFLNDQEQITSIEINWRCFSWMHGKMFPKYKKRNVTFFFSKLQAFHSRCNWGSASY